MSGRHPRGPPFQTAARRPMIAGVDIGGTKCAVGVLGRGGTVREVMRFPTTTPADSIALAVDALRRAGAGPGTTVGVACGGPLDTRRGLILSPPNLPGWDRVEVCRLLERALEARVFLMNDADANALAEWRHGAGRGCRSMIYLTAGTGMGAGLILDGRLYRGATGAAGEVGHVRLRPRGPVGFGKAGSFEGFCSGGGLSRLVRHLPPGCRPPRPAEWMRRHPDAKAIIAAARRRDPVALAVLDLAGARLGEALALLVDILNPERIVLGTIFIRGRRFLLPALQRRLREEALPGNVAACRILPASLGRNVGTHGAICAALHGLGRI